MTIPSTLLYLHPLEYQGRRLLGLRWPDFLELVRLQLRQSGIEEQDGEVLIFAFSHPHTAVAALLEAFARMKQELSWQPSQGPLPLQAVLHLASSDRAAANPEPFSTEAWNFLRQEVIHITRPLKHQWDRLMAGRHLAQHSFQTEEQGLYLVAFADQSPLKSERLFPNRELPLVGKHRECFYCGMTHHTPASCPSKLLSLPMQGLPHIGYMPFADLNNLYQKALAGSDDLVENLLAGVKASHVRREPLLQVFLAFFDLNRFYQIRFLHQVAFSFFTSWEGGDRHEQLQITNRNLHLGLDCLRVGQYAQAEQFFSEEVMQSKGSHFPALVGQAFRSLEQGREKDMESCLKKASSLAGQEKEQVYIGLLLSRFYDLQGDRWKAEHALDAILSLDRPCPEVQYRKCQLLARNGVGEQAYKQIRSLVIGYRELFMTALMDPMLSPVQGLLEDLLSTHYRALTENAGEGLKKAKAECEELRGWFAEENDPNLKGLLGGLAANEKQYERRSYYDVLDVAENAERLFYECHRIRELKLDRLKERLNQVNDRWEGFHSFWAGYPYQPLFGRFREMLTAIREKLETAVALSRDVRGQAFQAANAETAAAEAGLDELPQWVTKMAWTRIALDGLRAFGRKLVVTELLLGLLGCALFFTLHFYMADGAGPEQLLSGSWAVKKGLSVVTLLIAPLLALALTLWEITDSG